MQDDNSRENWRGCVCEGDGVRGYNVNSVLSAQLLCKPTTSHKNKV